MPVLNTNINNQSEAYKNNYQAMQHVVDDL
jgi:hypothetical protein